MSTEERNLELFQSLTKLNFFDVDWVLKNVMRMTERDIQNNNNLIKQDLRLKKLKRII